MVDIYHLGCYYGRKVSKVSEEHTASVIRAGTDPHIATAEINIDIITAVRTSNFNDSKKTMRMM
jgi:hypothetical protein